MSLLTTLMTSHTWSDIRPSNIAIVIYTAAAPKTNLLKFVLDWIFNFQGTCIMDWRLVLRSLLYGSRLRSLWIDMVTISTCSLFQKRLVGDEILSLYDIQVTHTKFLNKLFNLLIFMNLPKMKSWLINILKYMRNAIRVCDIKVLSTLKAISIYQYFSTEICNVLPWINIYFDTIQMINSLPLSIIVIT